jgi:hypothetical protein
MAGSHGKIERLLDTLKQRDHVAAIRITQLEALQPPRPRLSRYNILDVQIRDACANIVPAVEQLLAVMHDMNEGEQVREYSQLEPSSHSACDKQVAQWHLVHERLARHCRHMARLLGGAVHAELNEHVPANDTAPLLDDEDGLVAHVDQVAELPIDQFDPAEDDDDDEVT